MFIMSDNIEKYFYSINTFSKLTVVLSLENRLFNSFSKLLLVVTQFQPCYVNKPMQEAKGLVSRSCKLPIKDRFPRSRQKVLLTISLDGMRIHLYGLLSTTSALYLQEHEPYRVILFRLLINTRINTVTLLNGDYKYCDSR